MIRLVVLELPPSPPCLAPWQQAIRYTPRYCSAAEAKRFNRPRLMAAVPAFPEAFYATLGCVTPQDRAHAEELLYEAALRQEMELDALRLAHTAWRTSQSAVAQDAYRSALARVPPETSAAWLAELAAS